MNPHMDNIMAIAFTPVIFSLKKKIARIGTMGKPSTLITLAKTEETSKTSPTEPTDATCQDTAVQTRFIIYETSPNANSCFSLCNFFQSPLAKRPTTYMQLDTAELHICCQN